MCMKLTGPLLFCCSWHAVVIAKCSMLSEVIVIACLAQFRIEKLCLRSRSEPLMLDSKPPPKMLITRAGVVVERRGRRFWIKRMRE